METKVVCLFIFVSVIFPKLHNAPLIGNSLLIYIFKWGLLSYNAGIYEWKKWGGKPNLIRNRVPNMWYPP